MAKTNVAFYKEPLVKGEKPVYGVLAVFVDENEGNGMGCYAHVGQHSVCSQDYIDSLEPAKRSDYIDLIGELESIGYDLNVLNIE